YPASVRQIDETTPIETRPERKGAYGSLKVASDQFLLANKPAGLKLSLVRPGFILSQGLADPIVGMAFRTPFNRLLLIGSPSNVVPLTTRDKVNDVLVALANTPADQV